MSEGKKKINENHPLYKEYKKRSEEIKERAIRDLESLPETNGRDGPSGDIYRRSFEELKKLQAEFAFLWE